MDHRTDAAIADKQSQLNRSTSRQWHLYASHRQELERLLVPEEPGGRICVLGAGNCNDLDLRWLTQVYREVQLIDIDPEALTRATKSQKLEDVSRLRLRAPIDLTNIADHLGKWKQKSPAPDEIQTCLQESTKPTSSQANDLGGPFDVVLSPCVLSQLLMPLHDTIGPSHSCFRAMLSAIRSRHFRLMLDLLAPGGRGVFACDLLSSNALPDLARVPNDELPGVLQKMQSSGKCFAGLEPAAITNLLTRNPAIAPNVRETRTSAPWLWHLGLSKCYAVYAITFFKGGM